LLRDQYRPVSTPSLRLGLAHQYHIVQDPQQFSYVLCVGHHHVSGGFVVQLCGGVEGEVLGGCEISLCGFSIYVMH